MNIFRHKEMSPPTSINIIRHKEMSPPTSIDIVRRNECLPKIASSGKNVIVLSMNERNYIPVSQNKNSSEKNVIQNPHSSITKFPRRRISYKTTNIFHQ